VNRSDALDRVLPLTPTVYHVLVALANGPRHGYAIAREVEELTDGRIVMGPGTLYGSLQRMEHQGLIAETPNPGEEGLHANRRRYHKMTGLGGTALRVESERLFRTVQLAQQRLGI
jgi:DNA-binding PadR family transcriptional regulator